MTKRICVYCASSSQVDQAYFTAAEQLGEIIVQHHYELLYGGGQRGLMGKIADTVLERGGRVTGIIPRFMCDVEWHHTGLSELMLVDTMHERKEKLAMMADAVVTLPGGCGTMEELLEVITWKRLGIFTKPIIICNINGYFDPLITMLHRSVDNHFMGPEHRNMWREVQHPNEVIQAIQTSVSWDEHARSFAAL